MSTSTHPGGASPLAAAADVALRLRNLSKRYGQRLAVDNLTLEVRRGEIIGSRVRC